MEKLDYDDVVIEIVKDNPGINTFELVRRFKEKTDDYPTFELMDNLVDTGRIVELHYHVKDEMRFRLLYFPGGTRITVTNNGKAKE